MTDFFNSFKKFYKNNKEKGVLGGVLVFLKNFAYRHKYLMPFLFIRQDLSVAEEILMKLFEPVDVKNILSETQSKDFFKKKFSFGHAGDFDIIMLYALVRLTKPEIVVETGVASGRSSWAILTAMAVNQKGRLYSIDLPKHYSGRKPKSYLTKEGRQELCGFLPEGKDPGWLVPERLRSRWTLILRESKNELPKLVEKLEKIDIFYHDSEHSYENMKFEYETVWPKIFEGGLLLSDDVNWNNAFKEFLKNNPHKFDHIYRNFGVILK
jgi:predicted O-methyltransferase YrrM